MMRCVYLADGILLGCAAFKLEPDANLVGMSILKHHEYSSEIRDEYSRYIMSERRSDDDDDGGAIEKSRIRENAAPTPFCKR